MTEEIIKRVTGAPLNRRAFAVTSLLRAALSVQPISAATIATDGRA
jgi:hypothetical protein